jgi:putative ABC transport system ATP-binding protein
MSEKFAQAIIQVKGLYKEVASLNPQNLEPLVILHEVDFTIQSGETVAIVGPSGSGKSTLLGLIAGLDSPSRGQVMLDGESLYAFSEDDRAQLRAEKLGFVFQSFQLLNGFTALENVMLPLEIVDRKNARELALSVLQRVGLGERLSHYPNQLSGGEQQRVAIARAFAPQPKILLADEPTGNLDTHTGQRIIDLLFDLNTENGTTLVLVTHDQALAQRCDRMLQLEAGKLVHGEAKSN